MGNRRRLTQPRDFSLVHGATWERFKEIAADMVLTESAAWEKLVDGVRLDEPCSWSRDALPSRGLRMVKIRVTPATLGRMRRIAARWRIRPSNSMAAILATKRDRIRETIRRGLTNLGERSSVKEVSRGTLFRDNKGEGS